MVSCTALHGPELFPADSSTMKIQKQKSCWLRWLMTTQSQRSQAWLQGTWHPTAQEAHKTVAETHGHPQAQLRLQDQGRETLPGLTGDNDTDDIVLTHHQDWRVTVTLMTLYWHTTRTQTELTGDTDIDDTPPGLMGDIDTNDAVLTCHQDWWATVTPMTLYWNTTRTEGWQWHRWRCIDTPPGLMGDSDTDDTPPGWQWHRWHCIDTPPGLTGDSDTVSTHYQDLWVTVTMMTLVW